MCPGVSRLGDSEASWVPCYADSALPHMARLAPSTRYALRTLARTVPMIS
jgi:hypothetical protein